MNPQAAGNIAGWIEEIAEMIDAIDVDLFDAEMNTDGDRAKLPTSAIAKAQQRTGEIRRYLAGIRSNLRDDEQEAAE